MFHNVGRPLLISLAALLVALLGSVMLGSVFIPPQEILRVLYAAMGGNIVQGEQQQTFATIIFALRLPRTALIALTGAALSGSGCAYQGLFRNPLAEPYLIGVASGAGLGAVAAMTLRYPNSVMGLMAVPMFAFAGAIFTIIIVYLLARVGKSAPTTNLILSGVAFSSFATALTSFLMLNTKGEIRRALIWLLGGSLTSGWQPVLAMLPYVILGCGTLVCLGYALNVLQFGDEQARQLGLRVDLVRVIVVVASSLATAAAISFAGIIGFVGLIVPHLARLLWGGDYRRLLPVSIVGGAAFLLVADVIARIAIAPQEIPVGIVTALAGAPFFFWVFRRAKQQNYW